MASIIKIKRSSTASQVPGSLVAGELAINLPDKKLYSSNGSVVFEVGATNLANTNARINLLNTNLTGTNTALRTLISDRLQVANAAAIYATKTNPTTSGLLAHTGRATISTNLTVSGNTTIAGLKANNSLGSADQVLKTNGTTVYWGTVSAASTSQYLQVANAVATFQTISVERAALANTNARINLINTNLTGTNTALRTLISDRLQVANAAAIYATKAAPSTSGFFNHTGRLTVGTNLRVSGNTVIDGDLTVEGNMTYISTSVVKVDDSMVKLAANNSADTLDTGVYGIYVESATNKYAGYFRDASDGVFKFYTGLQTEPSSTVNTGATGYTLATVDAVIDGGTY